ncbi:hypothetical protein FVE85_9124 [Porphyridium purpureum]|uniref:Uncharacterized protein n=1 Tax=Porphyridium purpureum TaxID=35688 RepID=A0A5J4YPQ5_PORPP|nr:hypothetical protein FVE85_9124 [Porphyridium purpureum]|eukprot:POR3717..scf222_8
MSLAYVASTIVVGAEQNASCTRYGAAIKDRELVQPEHMHRAWSWYVNKILDLFGKDETSNRKNYTMPNSSWRRGRSLEPFLDAPRRDFRTEERSKARRYFMKRMPRECGPGEEEPIKQPLKRVEQHCWHSRRWLRDNQAGILEHNIGAFSVLSLRSFILKHTIIDTRVLQGLFCSLSKARAVGSVKKVDKKLADVARATAQDSAGKGAAALDPGHVDPVKYAQMQDDETETPAFSGCSHEEDMQKIDCKKARDKRSVRTNRANLVRAVNQLPSAKTPNTLLMLGHLSHLLNIVKRLVELSRRRRVWSLKFSAHCPVERIMCGICQRLLSEANSTIERHAVVSLEVGMFNRCSRGHRAGSLKDARSTIGEEALT